MKKKNALEEYEQAEEEAFAIKMEEETIEEVHSTIDWSEFGQEFEKPGLADEDQEETQDLEENQEESEAQEEAQANKEEKEEKPKAKKTSTKKKSSSTPKDKKSDSATKKKTSTGTKTKKSKKEEPVEDKKDEEIPVVENVTEPKEEVVNNEQTNEEATTNPEVTENVASEETKEEATPIVNEETKEEVKEEEAAPQVEPAEAPTEEVKEETKEEVSEEAPIVNEEPKEEVKEEEAAPQVEPTETPSEEVKEETKEEVSEETPIVNEETKEEVKEEAAPQVEPTETPSEEVKEETKEEVSEEAPTVNEETKEEATPQVEPTEVPTEEVKEEAKEEVSDVTPTVTQEVKEEVKEEPKEEDKEEKAEEPMKPVRPPFRKMVRPESRKETKVFTLNKQPKAQMPTLPKNKLKKEALVTEDKDKIIELLNKGISEGFTYLFTPATDFNNNVVYIQLHQCVEIDENTRIMEEVFVPVAEENDLIFQTNKLAIEKTLEEAKKKVDIKFAVSLSTKYLSSQEKIDELVELLARCPSNIILIIDAIKVKDCDEEQIARLYDLLNKTNLRMMLDNVEDARVSLLFELPVYYLRIDGDYYIDRTPAQTSLLSFYASFTKNAKIHLSCKNINELSQVAFINKYSKRIEGDAVMSARLSVNDIQSSLRKK